MDSHRSKIAEDEKNRRLRADFRDLYDIAQDNRDKLADVKSKSLVEMVSKCEKKLGEVNKPREHAQASELFCVLSSCEVAASKQLVQDGEEFKTSDFLGALKRLYGGHGNGIDWCNFGKDVSSFFADAPGTSSMLGVMSELDVGLKQRRQAVRVVKQPQTAMQKAEQFAEETAQVSKHETDRNVEQIWKILNELGRPVPFYNIVCNPHSFAQTVENIFSLTMLVNDKRVRLSRSEEGMMVIPLSRKELAAKSATDTTVQFNMQFNMAVWKEMVSIVDPADCLMPHRGPIKKARHE